MSLRRLVYRSDQFRKHLGFRAGKLKLAMAEKVLSPAQMRLFQQMQAGEQAHSLEVLERLLEQGEAEADLLVAALLHDVGKSRFPLRIWERAWIVLAQRLLPDRFRAWGSAQGDLAALPWWVRACAVAQQHPAWGAELALGAGCSRRAASLIRRHQEHTPLDLQQREDFLLLKLQAVDDRS